MNDRLRRGTSPGSLCLKGRHEGSGVAVGNREVISSGPALVVDQELECNVLTGSRRPGPAVATDTLHRNTCFPAQAASFASKEEGVAKADVYVHHDPGKRGGWLLRDGLIDTDRFGENGVAPFFVTITITPQ